MNNYKIKISCTSKNELCHNNKKISIKNYNKLNLEQLINNNDYIEKILILYKKLYEQNIITKSLEFLCKCDYEITDINFETFIKNMINIGFCSNNNTIIHLPRRIILNLITRRPFDPYGIKGGHGRMFN